MHSYDTRKPWRKLQDHGRKQVEPQCGAGHRRKITDRPLTLIPCQATASAACGDPDLRAAQQGVKHTLNPLLNYREARQITSVTRDFNDGVGG
jgi:hypothetical protein